MKRASKGKVAIDIGYSIMFTRNTLLFLLCCVIMCKVSIGTSPYNNSNNVARCIFSFQYNDDVADVMLLLLLR